MASKTEEAVQAAIAEQTGAETPAPTEGATEQIVSEPRTGPHVYQAISEITDALGRDGISKERGGAGTTVNFKYRGVDDVYAAINPLLARHGLNIIPNMLEHKIVERQTSGGKPMYFAYVKAEFDLVSSIDGSKHTACTYGEAQDMSDKATNKAMAVAWKYLCFLLFAIPVEGEDNDTDAHPGEDMKPSVPRAAKTADQPRQSPPKGKAPDLSEEEANTNYREATTLLEACTTLAGVKEVWDFNIKWDRIPKPWHQRLIKLRRELEDELKKPVTSSAPNFEDMPPPSDDDIPFPA